MNVGAAQFRQRTGRPAGWLVALAVLAHAMLPVLFAAHVRAAHAGEVAMVADRGGQVPAPDGEHSGGPGHCDMCRMLGTLASAGPIGPPDVAIPADHRAPVGRVGGADRPLLGRLLPAALCPRGPPAL